MEKIKNPSVGREADKFNLRLPEGMREAIAKAAEAEGRSMNTEIVSRLEKTFAEDSSRAINAVLMHVGLIQYLARCLEEVAEMVPPGGDSEVRVAGMLEVARALVSDVKT